MFRAVISSAVLIAGLIASWSLLSHQNPRWEIFLSSPLEVGDAWGKMLGEAAYWQDLGATLASLLTGYVLAVALGFALGLAVYELRRRKIDINVVLLVLGAIPVFALAPLLLLAFGSGFPTRVAVVVLSCLFFVASGVFQAVKTSDEELGSIARDLNLGDRVLWKRILLPGAMVYSVPTLKGAVALSLIGVFVAEWISSREGLGKLILSSMSLYNAPRVMVGIFSFMVIAGVIMGGISLLEQSTTRWRRFR